VDSSGALTWMCVALLISVAPSAFAQTAPEQTEQDAPPEPATQAPAAPLLGPRSELVPANPPQPPTTSQLTDDDLQVPPTLAPLVVDTSSIPSPPPPAPAPARFGRRGQWVMMGSSNSLGISNETYSGSSATYFNVGAEIGIDHFVANHVSVGVDAAASYGNSKSYGATTLSEATSTYYSGGIRFGVNVPLNESFSWYPRLTLGLASSHSRITPLSSFDGAPVGPPGSQSSVGPWINLYAPVLLEPASHFVAGFGPRLQHDFAVTRGGPYDGSQSTWVSGEFVVGGWWGGATPDTAEPASGAAPEKPAEPVFGRAGQIVLSTATSAWVGYRSYSQSKGSSTEVWVEPSVDYFVVDEISIGADAFVGYSSGNGLDSNGTVTELSATNFGIAPSLGANLPLTEWASIWLRGDLGFGTVSSSVSSLDGTNQHSRKRTWIDLSLPFLVHPSSHFFVGVGPFLFHELSDKDQYDFENRGTELGLSLVLGGWFDGPGTHAS
jgi:hypothetical protein